MSLLVNARSGAKDFVACLNGREVLRAGSLLATTQDHLGIEFPAFGDVEFGSDFGVNVRIVVLEVAAKSLCFQCRPGGELQHCVALIGPKWPLVFNECELLFHGLDDTLVLVEQNLRSI